jgi:haloacetate dehalogenase
MFEGFLSETLPGDGTNIHLVVGGKGPPLLLLHGYPQTHVCWHRVAPLLADSFTIVAPDLRGYGDSGKPVTDAAHEPYSKRRMAADQIRVMRQLGFERFFVAGHDRGGRVAHRLALDHQNAVQKLAVLDIAPTLEMYRRTDMRFAMTYFHWFFLVQPFDFPERLVGSDPEYYLRTAFYVRNAPEGAANSPITPEAFAEYVRCFRDPATIHATCEDYRASASIDLEHDEADLGKKLTCPLLVIPGEKGRLAKVYDMPALWRERAENVRHHGLPGGHFLPEETPDDLASLLREFFGGA